MTFNQYRLRILTAIVLCAITLISSLGVAVTIAPRASAFPSTAPVASEYIFYDNFERSGDVGRPQWEANPSKDTFSNDHAYNGVNSVKVATTGDGNSLSVYRFMSDDAALAKNEGIVTEVAMWDAKETHWELHEQANLFLANLGPTSYIGVGVHCDTSRELYSYWYSDGGAPMVYQMTAVNRSSGGWVHFAIQSVSHTQYRFYINHDWVGNCTIVDNTGMDYYGFYVHDINGIGTSYYFDEFAVYPFFQDQIWRYSKIAIGNNLPYTAYAALEPTVMYDGGTYKLWYRAVKDGDGPSQFSQLGYATSTDGLNWTPYPSGPLVNLTTAGACPYVFKSGTTYYLYYEFTPLAYHGYWIQRTSVDGIVWGPAVNTDLGMIGGSADAWDHAGLGNICVWKENSTFYALYEARGNVSIWTIGLATSTDGVHWSKYAGNPVMQPGFVLGNPEVHKYGGTYHMIAHGDRSSGQYPPTDIFLFTSTDLHTWAEATFCTQYTRLINYFGQQGQVADPTYYDAGDRHFIMYAGTKNYTNNQRLYISESRYSLEQIGAGDVLQWGKHLMGGIGSTTNVTASGKYWYSGINAFKGQYTNNISVDTTADVNVTIESMTNLTTAWTSDPGMGRPVINYTISGMDAGRKYYLFIDGSYEHSVTASTAGVIWVNGTAPTTAAFYSIETTINQAIFGPLPVVIALVMIVSVMGVFFKRR